MDKLAERNPRSWGALIEAIAVCIAITALVTAADTLFRPLLSSWLPKHVSFAPDAWWLADRAVGFVAVLEWGALILFLLYAAVRRAQTPFGFDSAGKLRAWILAFAIEALLLYLQFSRGFIQQWNPEPFAPYALFVAIAAGATGAIVEEIVFRGYLSNRLAQGGWPSWLQVMLSAVLFGLWHISYAGPDPSVIVGTAVLGGFWAFIFIWGGRSIWPVIAVHALNDAIIIPPAFHALATMMLKS